MLFRGFAIGLGTWFVSSTALMGQTPAVAAKKPSNAQPRKAWTLSRTPDGQPDLQGVWTNPTITPFERPRNLAGKAVLSEAEAAQLEERAAESRVDRAPTGGDVGSYNQFWFDSGSKVVATRQTSLVVDPADGRVPVKPSAEAKRDFDLAHNSDSYEYMSPWDRCVTRGIPAAMFPAGYNNAYQIVQTPGYVVILSEMIHNARIIPIDGRPHVAANIKQWDGDSRGRWEGDTLVVETTNYNGKGWISTSAAGGRIKGIPESQALRIVERFRRTDADTIAYQVTIDDPEEYSKPWTVSIPLIGDADYHIFEYACHEGNHAVENVLSGGRALDRAAR
jgi:hypothetical protein